MSIFLIKLPNPFLHNIYNFRSNQKQFILIQIIFSLYLAFKKTKVSSHFWIKIAGPSLVISSFCERLMLI